MRDPYKVDEDTAIARAIRAGKAMANREQHKATLNLAEAAMLETFPPEDRLAVIVFVRWSEGQKWKGGVSNKLAAKAAFVQAFRIAKEIYAPAAEEKKPSGLILPS